MTHRDDYHPCNSHGADVRPKAAQVEWAGLKSPVVDNAHEDRDGICATHSIQSKRY
jgi:hypothetical protein